MVHLHQYRYTLSACSYHNLLSFNSNSESISMAMAGSFRCFVGGLAWSTTDQRLEQVFCQFGDIIDLKIINDRDTGRSRGFGFVTFRDEQSMRDAIEGMNGQDLDGRNITVNEAQSRGGGGGGVGFRVPRRDGSGGGFRGPRRDEGGEGGYGRNITIN